MPGKLSAPTDKNVRLTRMSNGIRITLGIVATLVGLVWIGQGLNILPGSSMTGDMKWAYIGGVVALVGLVLLFMGKRKA